MKRQELIHQLEREGCVLLRPGSRHDLYINPKTGQAVTRHREIDNALAKHIRKYLGLE
jgi:hypothetical protein